jgi:hypothetical protein
MPSFVIADKCDGCKGGDKTACMYTTRGYSKCLRGLEGEGSGKQSAQYRRG